MLIAISIWAWNIEQLLFFHLLFSILMLTITMAHFYKHTLTTFFLLCGMERLGMGLDHHIFVSWYNKFESFFFSFWQCNLCYDVFCRTGHFQWDLNLNLGLEGGWTIGRKPLRSSNAGFVAVAPASTYANDHFLL